MERAAHPDLLAASPASIRPFGTPTRPALDLVDLPVDLGDLAFHPFEGRPRVALLGEPLRPRTGPTAIEPIAGLLAAAGDGGTSVPAYETVPRYATVVLIGDLLDPLSYLAAVVKRWSSEAVTGHLLQVTDPAEEGFPYHGRVRFEGLEAEASHLLGRAEAISTDYRDRLARHRDGLADLARTTGWTFGHHITDRSAESALLALFGVISGRLA